MSSSPPRSPWPGGCSPAPSTPACPPAWATADEFYGGDRRPPPRPASPRHRLRPGRGEEPPGHRPPVDGPVRADRPPPTSRPGWNRLSAGAGSKGERDYDWAWVTHHPARRRDPGQHWLLVRRRISDGELAFYRCWSPQPVPLRTLVRVAGTRWCIEDCFQAGKGEVGLDQHQVRSWHSWYRYTTLVMLAHAILAVIAARERADRPAADQTADPVDRQRNPPPLRETDHQHRPHHHLLAALVTLATPPPSTRPDQPLPPPHPTDPSTSIYITNPGCRTNSD